MSGAVALTATLALAENSEGQPESRLPSALGYASLVMPELCESLIRFDLIVSHVRIISRLSEKGVMFSESERESIIREGVEVDLAAIKRRYKFRVSCDKINSSVFISTLSKNRDVPSVDFLYNIYVAAMALPFQDEMGLQKGAQNDVEIKEYGIPIAIIDKEANTVRESAIDAIRVKSLGELMQEEVLAQEELDKYDGKYGNMLVVPAQ
jgi:hypothetical protein